MVRTRGHAARGPEARVSTVHHSARQKQNGEAPCIVYRQLPTRDRREPAHDATAGPARDHPDRPGSRADQDPIARAMAGTDPGQTRDRPFQTARFILRMSAPDRRIPALKADSIVECLQNLVDSDRELVSRFDRDYLLCFLDLMMEVGGLSVELSGKMIRAQKLLFEMFFPVDGALWVDGFFSRVAQERQGK